MKKIIVKQFIFIFILVNTIVYSQDADFQHIIFLENDFNKHIFNLFSYSVIYEVNFDNGNLFWIPEHNENIFNKQYVKSLTVNEISDNKEDRIKTIVYRNGLISSSDYARSDTKSSNIYEYDTKNRLLKYGFFTFEYTEIGRKRNFQDIYQQMEKIEVIPSGYRILIEEKNGSIIIYDFIFENNLLREVNTYLRGKQSLCYKFEYENFLIKKIIMSTSSVGQAWTRTINYEKENIISVDIFDNKNKVSTWNLLNYDKYGNWTIAELYSQDKLIKKYNRRIDYID